MATLVERATVILAAGNMPKRIEELVGRVNTGTGDLSIAHMRSPSGWVEPGQTPEFAEYSVVLAGTLRVTTRQGVVDVREGQAVMVSAGEWVQYSTPFPSGADYLSVCIPAFSPESVHRDA